MSDTLQVLDSLTRHPLGTLRGAACRALPPALSPLSGAAAAADAEVAAAGANLACGILSRLAAIMVSDPDSDVVAEACTSAGDVAYSAIVSTPSSGHSHVEATVLATLQALEAVAAGTAACQADAAAAAAADDDGDGDDDDVDDTAASLANAAAEAKEAIMAAVARQRGGASAP
jgi:hypothetical protein